MTAYGGDFETSPGVPAMKSVGWSFVMRYISGGEAKDITEPELTYYLTNGIAVGFVWETVTGQEMLQGASRGAYDGAIAGRQLKGLGVPTSVPIFVAFDADDRAFQSSYWQGQLRAYLNAFAHASGHFSFPYGSNRVIDFFQGGWQTQAWSDNQGTAVSRYAYLLQYAAGSPLPDTDHDTLFNSYAVYTPQQALNPPPVNPLPPLEVDPLVSALPNITASDHTHPKALNLLNHLLLTINPEADVTTDAAREKTVDEAKAFFKVEGDPKGRIGDFTWAALLKAATTQPPTKK